MNMRTSKNNKRAVNRSRDKRAAGRDYPVRSGGNAGLIAGIIIVVALVIAAGTLFALQAKQKRTQVKSNRDTTVASGRDDSDSRYITYQGQQYEYNKDIKTILFLGVDKKGEIELTEYPGEGGQSDCIILMAANQKDKTMQLFQISRNTMTDVDVYTMNGDYLTTTTTQITLQYAYGDGEKKSMWLTKKAVSKLLYGVPINSAVSMNIDGVSAVSDLLGGVTLTVPEDYTDVDPEFEKGKTITLRGAQAEKYVRYRDITVTGSNNDRMDRQTQFVTALISQLKSSSQRDSELYSRIMAGANPYFVTDMSSDDIQALTSYEMDGEIQKIPGEERAGEKHDEFYADEEGLKAMVVNTFYKPREE